MAQFIHFDEARLAAITALRLWLSDAAKDFEAMLIVDLFGKLRVVLFSLDAHSDSQAKSARSTKVTSKADYSTMSASLRDALADGCGAWWSGELLEASDLDESTLRVFEGARTEARLDEEEPRLRLVDRHRSRTAWFARPVDPVWHAPEDGPPIVVFYSFKGGLGRSTLLAAFAIQRAKEGQRVCILDLDLDSPGVGRLLSADQNGLTAPWGVLDFMLEHTRPGLRIEDYWHRCDRVSGPGEIRVMPAGVLDANFVDKLGRVDLEEAPSADASSLWKLLEATRTEFKPDWILLDARTGISESAGQLLSGIANLHVLLGSVQEQSWLGLDRVLDRLGKDRIVADRPQAEVLLVQAMVPAGEAGEWAKTSFAGRAQEAFEERYYAEATDDADKDQFWTVGDMQSQDAPHVPVPVEYDARLASFSDVADVAEALCGGAYLEVGTRIVSRFVREGGGL